MEHWLDHYYGTYHPTIGKGDDVNTPLAPGKINVSKKDPYSNLDFFRRSPENTKRYNDYLRYKGLDTLLLKSGIIAPARMYAVAQVWHESGGNNNIDNNLSGIVWAGQAGATKGRPLPKREQTATIQNYAHYDNLEAWAKGFKKELSKNKGKGAPITVTDAGPHGYQDYVNRLQANGYFPKSSYTSYINGMYNQLNKIQALIKWVHDNARSIDAATIKSNQYYPETHDYGQNEQAFDKGTGSDSKKWKWWQWALLGLGGIVVIKIIAD